MADEQIKLYGPLNFIVGSGVLRSIGKYSLPVGKKALILTSEHSDQAAGEVIRESLDDAGISYVGYTFSGIPSEKQARFYADKAKEDGADFFIAAGGGRVLDTAKYAAYFADKPILTVPTISATNASYRRNTILYDDEGRFIVRKLNKESPLYVLVDTDILAKQPLRYLNSGIIDSLVRLYEARPYGPLYGEGLQFPFAYQLAVVIYDYFSKHHDAVIRAFTEGGDLQTVRETVTAIIALPGIAANYAGGVKLTGFAHPFYNQLTRVNPGRTLLHGEIVGYGILVQLLLEGKPEEEFLKEYKLLQSYGFDYSLEDLGLDQGTRLKDIVHALYTENLPKTPFLSHIKTEGEIEKAIVTVDELVCKERREHHG